MNMTTPLVELRTILRWSCRRCGCEPEVIGASREGDLRVAIGRHQTRCG